MRRARGRAGRVGGGTPWSLSGVQLAAWGQGGESSRHSDSWVGSRGAGGRRLAATGANQSLQCLSDEARGGCQVRALGAGRRGQRLDWANEGGEQVRAGRIGRETLEGRG